ncbi:MAG TPA: hypothetical protein VMZ03_05455 [Chitinophagaceae bacterium]|nr:hypothetical protein [Chitinophagaceae bacterium]
MEVHAHTHTARKKWTHYFWEFIMLFLAVFCGFLAEYQLEHKIEKDRAKELARSFYDELKGDSANVVIRIQNRVKQENAFGYLMSYFRDSSLTNVSKTFQLNFLYGILFRSPSIFEPRTVVLDQLKNSGSLRYFKNEELQKLIGDLSVAIHNVIDRQALESTVRMTYLNPFIIQHYDYEFEKKLRNDNETDIFSAINKYEHNDEVIPFQFKSSAKLDREYAVNLMGFYGRNGMESTRTIHLKRYVEVNTALLKLLHEVYHLK